MNRKEIGKCLSIGSHRKISQDSHASIATSVIKPTYLKLTCFKSTFTRVHDLCIFQALELWTKFDKAVGMGVWLISELTI